MILGTPLLILLFYRKNILYLTCECSPSVSLSNSNVIGSTEYLLTPQVLCCIDVEPVTQVFAASRMEEKDPTNRCCRAYRSRRPFFFYA